MATATEPKHENRELSRQEAKGVANTIKMRLPFVPAIKEKFGIDQMAWKALVEAIFPNATSAESVILALAYCQGRRLDPFKRNVHIVPIYNSDQKRMVDTIWPGIGELRTTAFRTGEYAGRNDTKFGPDITTKVGSVEMTFPEWAQVTVKRVVKGETREFSGPQVYWLETYATRKHDDDSPNQMWRDRPRGQLDKCAEAAALRCAFPEEVGNDSIPEEVQHTAKATIDALPPRQNSLDGLMNAAITHQETGDEGDADSGSGEFESSTPDFPSPEFRELVANAADLTSLRALAEELRNDPTITDEQRSECLGLIEHREGEIRTAQGRGKKQGTLG